MKRILIYIFGCAILLAVIFIVTALTGERMSEVRFIAFAALFGAVFAVSIIFIILHNRYGRLKEPNSHDGPEGPER
jgi:hypothetical protein